MSTYLVIDVGNTTTVIGSIQQGKIYKTWHYLTKVDRTSDELGILLLQFFNESSLSVQTLKGVGICSVVPAHTLVLITAITQYLKTDYFEIRPEGNLPFKVHYEDPSTVGADRIANTFAAFKRFGGPGLVVDLGTATTIDVYDENGHYLGGNILPGLQTTATALSAKAAKLPVINIQFPKTVIGRSTEESMQIGIMRGSVLAIEGLIHEIEKEMGVPLKKTITGGFSDQFSTASKLPFQRVENLVIEGIYYIGLANYGWIL